jgi:hypothetical protein
MRYSEPYFVADKNFRTLRHVLALEYGWRVTGRGGCHHHLHTRSFEVHFWPGTGRLLFLSDECTLARFNAFILECGAPEIVPFLSRRAAVSRMREIPERRSHQGSPT